MNLNFLKKLSFKEKQLPFWQWLERREKIKALAADLKDIEKFVFVYPYAPDGTSQKVVGHHFYKSLLLIAKKQQALLEKK